MPPLPVRKGRAGGRRRDRDDRPDLEVPYVIARVAIDGAPGVFLTTNIVGCAVDAVEIGDRVRVKFEQHGDVYLPLFEKIA